MAAILLHNEEDLAKYENDIFNMLHDGKNVHFIMHDHNCDKQVEFNKLMNGEYPMVQIVCIDPSLQLDVFQLVKVFDQNNPAHFEDEEQDPRTPAGMTECPICYKETSKSKPKYCENI